MGSTFAGQSQVPQFPALGDWSPEHTLPRVNCPPAPAQRKGAGRRSGPAAAAGICLDLTTLSTGAQTQGNLEKALLSLARSPREPWRSPQPRGEGEGSERAEAAS